MRTRFATALIPYANGNLLKSTGSQPSDQDHGNVFNFFGDIYGEINGFALGDCAGQDNDPEPPEPTRSLELVTYNAGFIPGFFDTDAELRLEATTAAIVGLEADVMCL